MSLCLNPECGSDQNSEYSLQCQNCGAPLRLKQKYRSLKLLGQGGFGKTFLAIDETQPHQPRCVIKQLLPSARPERFLQEAQKLSTLGQHSQIPSLLDVVEIAATTYLVQEFIDGENLEQRLEKQGIFSPQDILTILCEVLPTLDYIHSKQVIHRDIKPANLIQPRLGTLHIVDFGAAKTLSGSHLVQTGTVIGSAYFTAPEQAIGKAIYASDIYSLGVTCIYLMTQVPPFTLYDISEGTWAWQDYLKQPVSNDLCQILNKMLLRPTKYRYSSCLEVLQDLEQSNPLNIARNTTTTFLQHLSQYSPKIQREVVQITPSLIQKNVQTTSPHPFSLELTGILKGHTQAINAVAMSPSYQYVATAGCEGELRLWKTASGHLHKVLHRGVVESIYAIDFSANGALIAAGCWDGKIGLWQTITCLPVCQLTAHVGKANTIKFSPDGQWLISGGEDGNICIWKKIISQRLFWTHLAYFQPIDVITNPHGGIVQSLVFSPDSLRFFSIGLDKVIRSWAIQTCTKLRCLDINQAMIRSIDINNDGDTVVVVEGDGHSISVWNIRINKCITTFKSTLFEFTQALFLPNSQFILSACSDGRLRIHNIYQEGCTYQEIAHDGSVMTLAIRGRTLVTGGADKIAKVWTLRQLV